MANNEYHGSVRAGNKDNSTINFGVFFIKFTKKNFSVGKGSRNPKNVNVPHHIYQKSKYCFPKSQHSYVESTRTTVGLSTKR
jgi:hypothetical protein